MRHNRLHFIALFLLYFVLIINTRSSFSKDLFEIGYSRIVEGDVATAKRAAIRDAFQRGFQRYILDNIRKDLILGSFQDIVGELIPKAEELVENFSIEKEEELSGTLYVMANIRFNQKKVHELLKRYHLIEDAIPSLKVLFMVSQFSFDKNQVFCWWKDPFKEHALLPVELLLYREFEESGFEPINRLVNVPPQEMDLRDMMQIELNEDLINRWGKIYGVDMVIYGEFLLKEGEYISLNLSSFDVKEKKIISSRQIFKDLAEAKKSSSVMEETVSLISSQLITDIITHIKSMNIPLNTLYVTFENIKNLKELRKIEEQLKSDDKIKDVIPRIIEKGKITYLVRTYLDRTLLLKRLTSIFAMDADKIGKDRSKDSIYLHLR